MGWLIPLNGVLRRCLTSCVRPVCNRTILLRKAIITPVITAKLNREFSVCFSSHLLCILNTWPNISEFLSSIYRRHTVTSSKQEYSENSLRHFMFVPSTVPCSWGVHVILTFSNYNEAGTYPIPSDTVKFKCCQKIMFYLRNHIDFVLFRKERMLMACWGTNCHWSTFVLFAFS